MEMLSAISLTNIPFPLFILDEDGRVLQASGPAEGLFAEAAGFLELVEEQAVEEAGRHLRAVPCPEAPLLLRLLARDRTSRQLCEVHVRREGGTTLAYCVPQREDAVVGQAMRQLEREIEGIRVSLGEKREQVAHSLRDLEKLAVQHDKLASLGTMAAGIAHEIRNPLASVRGFVQILKPHLARIGKERYAEIALDEIDRANGIIQEFLRASRPEEMQRRPVPVSKLIGDIASLCHGEAELAGARLIWDPGPADVNLHVDLNQMKQVLHNLVRNAIEAIAESGLSETGEIRLSAAADDGECRITVRDNGPGMDDTVQSRLFRPFFTTKAKGNGIGLTVCRSIVERHGGKLSVDSAPGRGSAFVIALPVGERTS